MMRQDLTFEDEETERLFQQQQAKNSRKLGKQVCVGGGGGARSPVLSPEMLRVQVNPEAPLPAPSPCPPQFHLNRAGIWSVVLVRVLMCREWATAAAVVVVLLLPVGVHWLPLHTYAR